MKLDGATIPIQQRSLGETIDLAIAMYRTDLRQVLSLTSAFAIPAGLATYWLCLETEAGMVLGLTIFYFFSPLLGAALVAGVGPRTFGDRFTPGSAARLVLSRSGRLLFTLWLPRGLFALLGALLYSIHPAVFLVYAPLVVLLSRGSMLSLEVILLEFLPGSQIRRRLSDLKYGDSVALMNRYAGTLVFCTLVVAINFVVLDLTFDFLFDSPLFFDRFEWMYFDEALISYFTTDPRCVSAVLALLWITYPLARLTLFFCYLDVRIRKECWDLELDFRVEARRLEGQP